REIVQRSREYPPVPGWMRYSTADAVADVLPMDDLQPCRGATHHLDRHVPAEQGVPVGPARMRRYRGLPDSAKSVAAITLHVYAVGASDQSVSEIDGYALGDWINLTQSLDEIRCQGIVVVEVDRQQVTSTIRPKYRRYVRGEV